MSAGDETQGMDSHFRLSPVVVDPVGARAAPPAVSGALRTPLSLATNQAAAAALSACSGRVSVYLPL